MLTDAHGEPVTPHDVLDEQELREWRAARSDRARPGLAVPRMPLLPVLDEDGIDAQGYAWGARP